MEIFKIFQGSIRLYPLVSGTFAARYFALNILCLQTPFNETQLRAWERSIFPEGKQKLLIHWEHQPKTILLYQLMNSIYFLKKLINRSLKLKIIESYVCHALIIFWEIWQSWRNIVLSVAQSNSIWSLCVNYLAQEQDIRQSQFQHPPESRFAFSNQLRCCTTLV